MTYYVTIKVDARYVAVVDADNLEEAKELAYDDYESAPFPTEMDFVDSEIIFIEDENGGYLYER